MNVLSWFVAPVPLWLQIGLVMAWLGAIGLTAESLHRSQLASPEVVRKIVHIGAGHVIVLAWWMQTPAWLGMGASVLFSAIALLSYRVPILPGVNSVGRKSLGTFFYAVSFGVLIACFWSLQQPYYAVLGILVMAWGDGLAALVGQRFGHHPYELWGMKKSWEGSLTMILVSFVISMSLLVSAHGINWRTWAIAALTAAIATGLEAFSRLGIDNLTVPVGSAMAAFTLSVWLFPG